jgi:hypothetical protein
VIRRALALGAWLIACAPVGADISDDLASQYAALAPKKALASDASGAAVAWSGAQASDAAAAVAAFDACEARRRQAESNGPCEVTRLNDVSIETGAAIRARIPRDRHPLFLWRFESATARLYLAGSMHVMKPTLHPLPGQLEAAFADADTIAVEVNTLAVSGERMTAILRENALLPAGDSIADVLPAPTLARLRDHLAAQGVPYDAVAPMKPLLIATQFAVNRLTALGYFPQFGVDQYFLARAGSRRVLELETFEEQMALLGSPSIDVQNDALALTLEQLDGIEPIVTEMVVAWLAGDDTALRRAFDEQSPQTEAYAAFNRRLLDGRNVTMANRVEEYLSVGGQYLVLVGAAHLAGAGSVVDVLAKRGIRGTRIYSDDEL